jgi:hypothetical protein
MPNATATAPKAPPGLPKGAESKVRKFGNLFNKSVTLHAEMARAWEELQATLGIGGPAPAGGLVGSNGGVNRN